MQVVAPDQIHETQVDLYDMLTVKNSVFDLPCTIGFDGEQIDARDVPARRSSSTPPLLDRNAFCSEKDILALPEAVNYDSNSDTKDTPLSRDLDAFCCLKETPTSSQFLQPARSDVDAKYGSANSTADNISAWKANQGLARSHAKQALLHDEWTRKTWKGHKDELISFHPHQEEEGVWKYISTRPVTGKKKQACLELDRETGFVWQRLRCPGSYYFKPEEVGDVITWYRSNGLVSAIAWHADSQVHPEICCPSVHSPEHSQPLSSAQGKRKSRHRRPKQLD